MFLVFADDTLIHVYNSPDKAVLEIGPVDVDTVRAAYDEQARPYRVHWNTPNRSRGALPGCLTFGLVRWVPGYRFEVSGDPDPDALVAAIRGASGVSPPEYTEWVTELERRLTEQ